MSIIGEVGENFQWTAPANYKSPYQTKYFVLHKVLGTLYFIKYKVKAKSNIF